jgi:hypothetical protein
MLKIILVAILFYFTFIGCKKENVTETFDYQRDTPGWLKEKINLMSGDQQYHGTIVYRYEWKNQYIYYIFIPVSSCAYCELYYQDGSKVKFTNEISSQDFLDNKWNELIIWEWNDNK